MKRHTTNFHQHQNELTTAQQQHLAQRQAVEFATAEEMIRHDAAQSIPPASLAARLQQSIAREPKPPRSWWQRWLGQAGCR